MAAAACFTGSTGLRGEAELTVAPEHTAAHASGGVLPAVLSTPRLPKNSHTLAKGQRHGASLKAPFFWRKVTLLEPKNILKPRSLFLKTPLNRRLRALSGMLIWVGSTRLWGGKRMRSGRAGVLSN